jgi:hypothetical protein
METNQEWKPAFAFNCLVNKSKKKVELRFDNPDKRNTYMQAKTLWNQRHSGINDTVKKYSATVKRYNCELKNATALLNHYYESFGLELDSVKLREISSRIGQENQTFEFAVEESKERMDLDTYRALQTADETKTSERNFEKWNKLLNNGSQSFPTLYSVRALRQQLNQAVKIRANKKGFYADLNQKISLMLQCFAKNNAIPEEIKVKFTADGLNLTKTGRKLLAASMSFIQPQIKENANNSLPGHFLIGIIFLNSL